VIRRKDYECPVGWISIAGSCVSIHQSQCPDGSEIMRINLSKAERYEHYEFTNVFSHQYKEWYVKHRGYLNKFKHYQQLFVQIDASTLFQERETPIYYYEKPIGWHIKVMDLHNNQSNTTVVVPGNETKYKICTDEFERVTHDCLGNMIACQDGRCIAEIYICDQIVDCPDGVDELECAKPCLNYNSLSVDLSVKEHCEPEGQFCTDLYYRCRSHGCVYIYQVCDGNIDCEDRSDENELICFKMFVMAPHKKKENTMCVYNRRDPSLQTINDEVCEYDECSRNFKCYMTYCIPLFLLCDGSMDCPYGEDEENCFVSICQGLLQCRDSKVCVHPDNICDGIPDCVHQDDEVACPIQSCPKPCQCWFHVVNCSSLAWKDIPENIIDAFTRSLIFSNNKLIKLDPENWKKRIKGDINLPNLLLLNFSKNSISMLHAFPSMKMNVHLLDLRFNLLAMFENGFFLSFPMLADLLLQGNPLHAIKPYSFQGLTGLHFLFLQSLSLTDLEACSFCGLLNTETLDLSMNMIKHVQKEHFKGVEKLVNLKISHNPIEIFYSDTFQEMLSLNTLYVDNRRTCCTVRPSITCLFEFDHLEDCGNLLPHTLLLVVVVNLALIIFSTNAVCIFFRAQKFIETKFKGPFTLMILFLHVVDGTAGFYLLTLGVMHVYYEGRYLQISHDWKSNLLCRIVGGLIWWSVQMSSITVFCVSVNKMFLVWKPFEKPPIKKRYFISMCSFISLMLLLQIVIQSRYENPNPDKFCLDIYFSIARNHSTRSYISYLRTIQVFSNMFCMIVVFTLNMSAVYLARKSAKHAGRQRSKNDVAFERRNIMLSFACILPWSVMLSLFGLALSGYDMHSPVFAWLVVVGVSISSVINPVLYTLSTEQYRDWFSKIAAATFQSESDEVLMKISPLMS